MAEDKRLVIDTEKIKGSIKKIISSGAKYVINITPSATPGTDKVISIKIGGEDISKLQTHEQIKKLRPILQEMAMKYKITCHLVARYLSFSIIAPLLNYSVQRKK